MKLNRTTMRTVDILKLVSKKSGRYHAGRICEKLELPKTSAYDIVTTLVEMGMVNVTRGQKQTYTIGLTAYRIGINYTNNLDFIGIIEPELRSICQECGKDSILWRPFRPRSGLYCKGAGESNHYHGYCGNQEPGVLYISRQSDSGLLR